MSSFKKVWEDIVKGEIPGVKIVRQSLHLKLTEGEDIGQLLEKKKGYYLDKLKGWLLDYKSVNISPLDSSGRWLNVEGDYAVFVPVPGLKISTTFRRLEDGQPLCGAKVRVVLMPLYL